MKIWILSVDDECATWAKVFADKESAEAYFRETVEPYWDSHFPDDEMPEDAHAAWDKIVNEGHCIDTISLNEDEFALAPVYEAGPDLLEALEEAEGFIQGFADDEMQEGMDELCGTIEAAIKKAHGGTPVHAAATPSEALECLKEALEVMGNWGDEGEPGWAIRARRIINEAEGRE